MHAAAQHIAAALEQLEPCLDRDTNEDWQHEVPNRALEHFRAAADECDPDHERSRGKTEHSVYCGRLLCWHALQLAEVHEVSRAKEKLDELLHGISAALTAAQSDQRSAVLTAAHCVDALACLWRERGDHVTAYGLHKMALEIRQRVCDNTPSAGVQLDVAATHHVCGLCARAGDALTHFATAKRLLTKLQREGTAGKDGAKWLEEATELNSRCRTQQWQHQQEITWVQNERDHARAQNVRASA